MDPTWTDVSTLEDTEPLDRWEAVHGNIRENDGPLEDYVPVA